VTVFNTSESTEKLDSALAKAQGEVSSPNQTKVNPFFKSKYADISDIWNAIRPALKKYEVSLTQWPVANEDVKRAHVITRVAHKGEWITCEGAIPISKGDAHGYASAVTYLKRISLGAVLGISFEEDDDGNKSIAKGSNKNQYKEKPAPMPTQGPPPGWNDVPPPNMAPQSSNIPSGTSTPPDVAQTIIPFGKFKGQSFAEIGPDQLKGYLDFMEKRGIKEDSPMFKISKLGREFISGQGGEVAPPPEFDQGEELPF